MDKIFIKEHIIPLLRAFESYEDALRRRAVWSLYAGAEREDYLAEWRCAGAVCRALREYAALGLEGEERDV